MCLFPAVNDILDYLNSLALPFGAGVLPFKQPIWVKNAVTHQPTRAPCLKTICFSRCVAVLNLVTGHEEDQNLFPREASHAHWANQRPQR